MKTNLSVKDETIYQVILQHLFDFSPFVQENQPFDFLNWLFINQIKQ